MKSSEIIEKIRSMSLQTANYPRLRTDKFFVDYENKYQYSGFMDKTFRYIEDFQLLKPELWRRFVQQFREDADRGNAG